MESLYRLEVESLDLGPDVRAVGLELIEPESREPVTGAEAASIWAAVAIAFREPNAQVILIPEPDASQLQPLFERFVGETFGIRAGSPRAAGDTEVEGALAERGVDAYHSAFPQYLFCLVCDFEGGYLTVLSTQLWASEVSRRAKAAVENLQVEVTRPA